MCGRLGDGDHHADGDLPGAETPYLQRRRQDQRQIHHDVPALPTAVCLLALLARLPRQVLGFADLLDDSSKRDSSQMDPFQSDSVLIHPLGCC